MIIIHTTSFLALLVVAVFLVSEVHGGHVVERMSMKERWTKQSRASLYRVNRKQSHGEHVKRTEEPMTVQNGSIESNFNDSDEEVKFIKETQLINISMESRTVEFINDDEWNKAESSIVEHVKKLREIDPADSIQEDEIDKGDVESREYHGNSRQYSDLNKINVRDDEKIQIDVETVLPVFIVDDHFISFTLDYSGLTSQNPWLKFNISSPRVATLMKGLAPSILRIGGTSAAFAFFDAQVKHLDAAALQPKSVVLRKDVLIKLATLTKSVGDRFLIDLNIQQRLGKQWSPADALHLFEFLISQGLNENIDWELGNEPEYDKQEGQGLMEPEQVANDFLILDRVIRSYPEFSASRIIGPDCVGVQNGSLGYNILKATANISGSILRALTFHHYYFNGQGKTYKDFIDPSHFSNLAESITLVRSAVSSGKHPTLPVWIGETSDAFNSGTPNVTDRYVSGFLWLDKLGLAARMGVGVVMRQTFYGGFYALVSDYLQPNPDYWLTLIYRQLVGARVLNVAINGVTFSAERAGDNTTKASTTRVYAHCTKVNNNISITPSYPRGSVTLMALNVSPTTSKSIVLPPQWAKSPSDLYLMTAPDEDILSRKVMINGVVMKLVDDATLPHAKPVSLRPGEAFVLPPLSFGFLVVSHAAAAACL